MKIEQNRWTPSTGWKYNHNNSIGGAAQLVILFGSTSILKLEPYMVDLKKLYPHAHFIGCSTAGEIMATRVYDDSLVATAIQFEYTPIKGARIDISKLQNSAHAGEQLAESLPKEGLKHVLVFSDGLKINGSELVKGLTKALPEGVPVTGGLAGDGARFEETLVLWDSPPAKDTVAILGFYGERIKIAYASLGGWDAFGPERFVTRSKGNILYELDGKSALDLYKNYLGEHAQGLPATGLLFPLCIRSDDRAPWVVRTILSVNEKEQSLTFAGDVPEGSYARLMKANFDRLIDGSVGAAQICFDAVGSQSPDLAILISCVGRKLVLKQRIEEEVEEVRDILGEHTLLTGFYSYGEISPFTPNGKCELHNQTMTITTFAEQ